MHLVGYLYEDIPFTFGYFKRVHSKKKLHDKEKDALRCEICICNYLRTVHI
jgi:hypothetical protein